MGEPISVILPMHRWHERAEPAIRSVLDQSYTDFELIVVINGTDRSVEPAVSMIAESDDRVRILSIERENIAAGLNYGIQYAKHELIARMDSDDLSHRDRFKVQQRYLALHHDLAGCGTGANFVDCYGDVRDIVLPPTTPQETRWRVLLWNPFVHGSMMLRKSHLLDVGGYDEQLDRAQDYDLWIRLSPSGLGGIPELLYTHTVSDSDSQSQLDPQQSAITADRLAMIWAQLPDTTHGDPRSAIRLLARGELSGRPQIERMMEQHGPSRELLMTWFWSCWRHPIGRTDAVSRTQRLHKANALLESNGTDAVWIWGAGDFGRFIIAHQEILGAKVLGVVDDHREGEELDRFMIRSPSELEAPAVVLIASDLYEDQIWKQSEGLRSSGVHVLRLPSASQTIPGVEIVAPSVFAGDSYGQ